MLGCTMKKPNKKQDNEFEKNTTVLTTNSPIIERPYSIDYNNQVFNSHNNYNPEHYSIQYSSANRLV